MMRRSICVAVIGTLFGTTALAIGDGPVIEEHLSQDSVRSGDVTFEQLFEAGARLFSAKFNTFDGQGRPGTTGGGAAREPGSAPAFIRTSAPDANSCAGCHNDPFPGAAGDIVANVFVLAQTLDPVTDSVGAAFSNNRNTLGMHGAGPIEMLAREMSNDLLAIRDGAAQQAADAGNPVTRALTSKGVSFGTITVAPDGTVDGSAIEGVDADLIVKPFHQKGVVISLREFSNNAMNHHHGMQTVERFGIDRTGTDDFDQDGVTDELTVGDVTAVTIWQAALGTPGQVISDDPKVAVAVLRGERHFDNVGCADCHVPELKLNTQEFSEPNPFNPPGNLQLDDAGVPFVFDMTTQGQLPRPEPTFDGGIIVRAYTDLKRHDLCDEEINHFCNEQVVQGGVPTQQFLTRKLWDVGNTAPYGHVGDLTTMTAAIDAHGGEARPSRDAYFALPQRQQDEIIEFLKSLQILPPGTPELVIDTQGRPVDKVQLKAELMRPDLAAPDLTQEDRFR